MVFASANTTSDQASQGASTSVACGPWRAEGSLTIGYIIGVDCGGNECRACSNYARAEFQKQLWITEFAPSTDDAGYSPTLQQKLDRTNAYIDEELPKLESDPYVYRYAWFMPKTNIGSLDHVDLLTISPADRTPVGQNYLTEGF